VQQGMGWGQKAIERAADLGRQKFIKRSHPGVNKMGAELERADRVMCAKDKGSVTGKCERGTWRGSGSSALRNEYRRPMLEKKRRGSALGNGCGKGQRKKEHSRGFF